MKFVIAPFRAVSISSRHYFIPYQIRRTYAQDSQMPANEAQPGPKGPANKKAAAAAAVPSDKKELKILMLHGMYGLVDGRMMDS